MSVWIEKKSSVVWAIGKTSDQLLRNIDDGLYSCCLHLDLSKAFDTIRPNILFQKLQNFFWISRKSPKPNEKFLTNRYQYTKVGNTKSSMLNVDCGTS